MAQLEIETAQEEEVPEELTDKLKRLTIEVDIRSPWVKAWGRHRKVARRSKFGVNTQPLKKPAAERKKNNWVDAPKEQKKEHPPKGKGKSIIKTVPSEDDGQLCFATFKEQQNPERHANLSSVMEEMPQANERLNKRCLGGNLRISFFNFSNFQFSTFNSVFSIQ
ncbi:hypothetical protein QL285_087393 [Trifolium repens]|nr:hypothetical protein QL285_087393 [Trifolium repens]